MRAPTDDDLTTVALQRLVAGVLLIAATVWLGIQVVVEADVNVDEWWNVFVDRFAFLDPAALAMNFLGGGWFATFVVPLGGVALLLVLRRPRGALFVVVASVGSVALVQLLKALFGRARPEDMIVFSDHGSFPSGHTGNAASVATIAVILFPRVAVAVVGGAWVFAMAFSRTQVHAHWLSDTVGGALVGVGATLVVAAAFTRVLDRESERVRSLG
ncbi:phosphatase PAP2 family protein [Microbacterium hominis]|uniref:phosphatase PAP2 family protein n=1 Tax=Microbacterium TaxID=33882 RepID=UPI00168C0C35|nr:MULTISPECIES: phosphatase PAP2 family protein [Microbacterium]QOC24606.1 phosphatase PAP2 family protein [Microbacterium hominis]QOC28671.1 phosphatase PAP2 family protein [Microbacterium hominis]QYF99095.1 phosphatase PAP2 family protein [Microbacterium sp. PAMC21962]